MAFRDDKKLSSLLARLTQQRNKNLNKSVGVGICRSRSEEALALFVHDNYLYYLAQQ